MSPDRRPQPTAEHVPTSLELALASLVVALEETAPGIVDRWVKHAESEALDAEVRRLHEQAPNPDLVARMHDAMVIARQVRFIVKSSVKPVPLAVEPEKRKRRRARE